MFLKLLSEVRRWLKRGPAPEMKKLSDKEIDDLMTTANSEVGNFFQEWLQGEIDIIPPAPEKSCDRGHQPKDSPGDGS